MTPYNEFTVKKIFLVFSLIFILPAMSAASILKITVDAPIHPITSEYIRSAIDRAEEENARLLIIELTPRADLIHR